MHLPWGADESDGGRDPVPHGLRVCFPPSQSLHPVTLVSGESGLLLNIRGPKKGEISDSLEQKDTKEAILIPCKPMSARNYSSVPDLRSANPSCSEPEFHIPNSKIKEVKSAFLVNIQSSAQVRRGACSGEGRALERGVVWRGACSGHGGGRRESCFLLLLLSLTCSSSNTHPSTHCCCLSLSFPAYEPQTVERHTCWEGRRGMS